MAASAVRNSNTVLMTFLLASAALLAGTATTQEETHIRVFWHDIFSSPEPRVVKVAVAPSLNASDTGFGTVYVMDDPLTDGPNITDWLLGRGQGMYASTGKDSIALLVAMNFVFVDGPYNGSSIAIFGHNPARPVREMPVVGGTSVFRFAIGYCQLRTHWFDNSTGDATVPRPP